MGALAHVKESVKRRVFGHIEFRLFGPVAMREPQQEIRVWLCGLGPPRDVTYRNVMANSRPHTIGIGLDRADQRIESPGTGVMLKFEERTGRKHLLGEIDLEWRGSIDLSDGQVLLFRSGRCRNFCLPKTLLWRQYMGWGLPSLANERPRRPRSSDVHAGSACHVCVLHLSAAGISGQRRRRGQVQYLSDGPSRRHRYRPLLAGAQMHQFGRDAFAALAPRRAALASVPIEQTDLVYRLGPNHFKADFDWDEAPFGALASPVFGLPVPDFSLRVRDMEVSEIRELGSHQFFICRIVEDQRLADGEEFFESHSFYQAWKQRRRDRG